MTLRCITVDDEPLSLAKIEGFIAKTPYLTLVSSFLSAIEALNYLKQNHIDLIFLDIQMDNLTGIQLLEILDPKPDVILTTAYDQYALKGYELNVSDYLLKPYSFERFLKAVEKVYQSVPPVQTSKESDTFIFLKNEYRHEKASFNDILYIESQGDYLSVVMRQSKIFTLMTLKTMAEMLPAEQFIRVHKSFIVAIDKIDAIEHARIRIKDKVIPIGETYRETILKRLSI